MLLQVIFLPFLLILFGGIISLAAVVEPHHERFAPRVGFPIFYAGVFSLILSWGPGLLCETLDIYDPFDRLGFFFGGYFLGMIGGALFGYVLALRHKRHIVQSTMQLDEAAQNE
jgi:hypothetical protein